MEERSNFCGLKMATEVLELQVQQPDDLCPTGLFEKDYLVETPPDGGI